MNCADSSHALARARQQLDAGAVEEALQICAGLLDAGAESAELHLLLAEIYDAQGRPDFAARARRRAARLSPESAEAPRAVVAEEDFLQLPVHSPWRIVAIAAGLGLAAAGMALAWRFPGRPAMAGVPWMYVGVGGIGGSALALGLAAAGALGSFDDELAFSSLKTPGKMAVPNGVMLLVTGVISPYAALAAFAIICLSEGRLLRGTLVAFVLTYGWAGLLALMAHWRGLATAPIIGWGLINFVFVAVLLGWAVGYMFRAHPWE